MAMSSSESDDDEFMLARYGTPMEELNDPEVPKKPIAVHEQIVTDAQGRRRFHGAFTGGFSAGYYNTVDTEEGWTPSGFHSSRSDRSMNRMYVPEDFMDDEDMSEFGIAPKRIVTQTKFSSNKDDDKKLKNKDKFEKNTTMLLGLDMIQTLVVAVSNNIGTKLLQQMGWKPGQGIGPKIKRLKNNPFIPENVEFAPEDCIPMEFQAKDNIFGLGYTGMDPKKALHDKVKKSSEIAIRTKSGAKLSFVGHAFGVGAYEDEDQDIYAQDSMANYDLEMTEEKSDGTYGWSKPSQAIIGTDTRLSIASAPKVLQNFHKTEKTSRRKSYPPPILPPDYDPLKKSKVMHKYGLFGAPAVEESSIEEEKARKFERLDPNDRRKILDERSNRKDSEVKIAEIDSIFSLLKPADRQRLQILKHGGVGQPLPPPKRPKISGFYEPFASNPLKQKRYESYLKFLKMKQSDPYTMIELDPSMTEWEIQQEREEFTKSSRFFQPLSATMSSRFAPESEALKQEDEKEMAQREAVKLKMFGMLTRDSFEWHPDPLLCKRFNVPNPYPHSDISGIPGQDSGKLGLFLHPDDLKPKLKISDKIQDDKTVKLGSKVTGIVKDTKNPPLFNRNISKSVSRWDAKPREQLALLEPQISNTIESDLTSDEIANVSSIVETITASDKAIEDAVTSVQKVISHEADSDSENNEKHERPPMDIFRAIFVNSDSDSSESDGENEVLTRSSSTRKKDKNIVHEQTVNDGKAPESKLDINEPGFHTFSISKKTQKVDEIQAMYQETAINEDGASKIHSPLDESWTVPISTNEHQFETSLPSVQPSLMLKIHSSESSNFENAHDDPLFPKFSPKKEHTTIKMSDQDSSTTITDCSIDTFVTSSPPGDVFGPALPPIKVPRLIGIEDKKSKKSKSKKKKHKKEKKNKK